MEKSEPEHLRRYAATFRSPRRLRRLVRQNRRQQRRVEEGQGPLRCQKERAGGIRACACAEKEARRWWWPRPERRDSVRAVSVIAMLNRTIIDICRRAKLQARIAAKAAAAMHGGETLHLPHSRHGPIWWLSRSGQRIDDVVAQLVVHKSRHCERWRRPAARQERLRAEVALYRIRIINHD